MRGAIDVATVRRYGYAALSVAIAVSTRLILERLAHFNHPYTCLYIAVLWAAWYGGYRAAIFSVIAGQVLNSVVGIPRVAGASTEFERYLLICFAGTVLIDSRRRAEFGAARSAAHDRERLVQLQTEIAQRKQAERAAAEAQNELRVTFDHAPVGLCRLDTSGSLIDINPRFAAITGYPPGDLTHITFGDLIYPDDLDYAIRRYRLVCTGSIPYSEMEHRWVRKDGSVIWVDQTMTAVPGSECPQYVVAVIQDVTMRRLADERLREAQRAESIGLLAGGIAHDFNNLLTAVLGNASLALETIPRGGSGRQLLENLIHAADDAARLTNQLLAYAGKTTNLPEEVDLSQIVRRAVDLVRPSIDPEVDLKLSLALDLPILRVDPTQVQQVATTLLMNSKEAVGGHGRGNITVSTRRVRFGERDVLPTAQIGDIGVGEYLLLRVEDSGIGMNDVIIRRIFEPFFSTKFIGRGLELAAVSGIVRSYGGGINVSSTPGSGTVFSIYLPLGEVHIPGTDRASQCHDCPPLGVDVHQPKRPLI